MTNLLRPLHFCRPGGGLSAEISPLSGPRPEEGVSTFVPPKGGLIC